MCGIFETLNKVNPMAHIGGKDNKWRQFLAPQSPHDLVQSTKKAAMPWKDDPILKKLRGGNKNDIPPPNDIMPPVQGVPMYQAQGVPPQIDQAFGEIQRGKKLPVYGGG